MARLNISSKVKLQWKTHRNKYIEYQMEVLKTKNVVQLTL